jgi:hypothetical protein
MKRVGVASIGALILAGALPAFAQDHAHGTVPAQQAMLEQGSKWATDAPLRAGMEGIRERVAALRAKDRFKLAD